MWLPGTGQGGREVAVWLKGPPGGARGGSLSPTGHRGAAKDRSDTRLSWVVSISVYFLADSPAMPHVTMVDAEGRGRGSPLLIRLAGEFVVLSKKFLCRRIKVVTVQNTQEEVLLKSLDCTRTRIIALLLTRQFLACRIPYTEVTYVWNECKNLESIVQQQEKLIQPRCPSREEGMVPWCANHSRLCHQATNTNIYEDNHPRGNRAGDSCPCYTNEEDKQEGTCTSEGNT